MAKFKQVPQSFLFEKLVRFWGNMVKNYQGIVCEDNFFRILNRHFDHAKAVKLIEAAYTPEEIKKMSEGRSTRYNRLHLDDSLDDVFQQLWNREKKRGKCRAILKKIQENMLAKHPKSRNEPLEKRFLELKRIFRLTDLEYDILLVAYVVEETCFHWPMRIEGRETPLYFAMALDRSYGEVLKAMTPKGALRKFELLDDDWGFSSGSVGGYLVGSDAETIERRFYKRNETAEVLPWDFYGDLAATDGEVLKRMLSSRPTKCNILLYGAPGTGKTSFARTLAKELGRTAWEIKQGDDDGRNMKSESRMVGIQICNEQENADESLMIVDEADELLRGNMSFFGLFFGGGSGGKSTEKGVVNAILDEMKMPAVWISNTASYEMDESVRRRFDYSICFEQLNNAQRVSIWRNIVQKMKLGKLISEAQVADYAAKYATSAGGISTVLSNVRRMRPTKGAVDELVATLMKPHCRLMDVRAESGFLPDKGYSLEGLNIKGKVGLERVVKSVRNYFDASFNAASADKPRMNLLLFGPPGTGKTEFVKYLGKELDRKVLVMKGSDLLSKFVGESEQNIAKAFRRAEAEHAILFLDEVDGLLQNRASARANWEVTQVNEILQQMENFNGVMIAATNFRGNLDPAVMRRFTFKLEFDYLDADGKRVFFEKMFQTGLTAEQADELARIPNLAPGDFRTVRQEQFYLGGEVTVADRLAALREESHLKLDGACDAKIGFAA